MPIPIVLLTKAEPTVKYAMKMCSILFQMYLMLGHPLQGFVNEDSLYHLSVKL